jgi:hypothetical protein
LVRVSVAKNNTRPGWAEDEGITTMLKSLAIGLLTLTAALSTAAFAGNNPPPATQGQDGVLCWILPWLCESHGKPGGGGATAAPELDPAGAIVALTLLAGGLAVVRGRRSARKK